VDLKIADLSKLKLLKVSDLNEYSKWHCGSGEDPSKTHHNSLYILDIKAVA